MRVTIRATTPADAVHIARMNAAFNGVDDRPEPIAARILACQEIETPIVAEVDGQVCGFACVRHVPCVLYAAPYAELTELYVELAFRRRGAGRALVQHAERLARERGATELIIMTGVNNTAAQALYRALGYDTYALALHRELTE